MSDKGNSIGDHAEIKSVTSMQLNTGDHQGCVDWAGSIGGSKDPGMTKPKNPDGAKSKALNAGKGK